MHVSLRTFLEEGASVDIVWTFCGQGQVLILRILKVRCPCPLATRGPDCSPSPLLPACGRRLKGMHQTDASFCLPSGSETPFPQSLPEGFSHSSDAITNEELQAISEKIYRADTNKAQKEDIILNSQNAISPSETRDQVDHCPEPCVPSFLSCKVSPPSLLLLMPQLFYPPGRRIKGRAKK